MKLLVTGGNGQVGTELLRQAENLGWVVIGLNRACLDITDRNSVRKMVLSVGPEVIINAAAYTAVDRAESDRDASYAANAEGPERLATICSELGIPMVHYSTDYVFDGKKNGAYVENDPVAPLGVYGASKVAGENAVRTACSQHLIFRTSWVFSRFGHNFVKTMLSLGSERKELAVVSDQFGKPTAAAEIARVTLAILSQRSNKWGTYHLAQPEVTNWHDFAEAVFTEAGRQGVKLVVSKVNPIPTSEYPTLARRPSNSELNCDRLETCFGISIRPWKDSLADVVKELKYG